MLKHAEWVFSRFANALLLAKSIPNAYWCTWQKILFKCRWHWFRYSPSETFILKSLISASKVLQWKYLSTVLITCMRDWLVWQKNSKKQCSKACVCSWEQESVAHTSPAIFDTKSSEYILLRIISLNDILCACETKTRTESHEHGNTFIESPAVGTSVDQKKIVAAWNLSEG